ncbi:phosphotransferase [Rhodohalobacter mucosus]|uniref:Phosphotransferase n=2 Tax=Rhodohalobacter mucosus TaxID=2079485 RepID=A0A316TQ44_9BACT|nr:phosphotransferase [Rhodohalobacter mucosus]
MAPDRNQIFRFVQKCLPDFEPAGSPEELIGGNINRVWRIPGDSDSVIVKYAPPYIAASPDVPMNSNRLSFEARALGSFMQSGPLSGIDQTYVQPPELLGHDTDASLLLMEDITPSVPWFEALRKGRAEIETARDLGRFIGALHRITYGQPAIAGQFHNMPVQETRYHVQYMSLAETLSKKDDPDFRSAAERCRQLGRLLMKQGRCLLMGDLWPPSLLWSRNKIRIIDWEFVHYGRPLQDLAHFCAHCMMHHAVASAGTRDLFTDIWGRTMNGYKRETSQLYQELINGDEIEWFSVHVGAEILARTIGAFSQGYLFEDPKQRMAREKISEEAVKLMAGNVVFNKHLFLRMLYK